MRFLNQNSHYVIILTILAFLGAVVVLFFLTILKKSKKVKPQSDDFNHVANIAKSYDLDLKPEDEKEIPIKSIYIYPIRGVKGIKVDEIEVSPFGVKGDRNWVIIGCKRMGYFANNTNDITSFLRQSRNEDDHNIIEISL